MSPKNLSHPAQIFIVLLGLFLFLPAKTFAIEDAILAVVNDEPITAKDLNDYFHSIYSQLMLEGRSEAQINEIMDRMTKDGLTSLIEDRLILSTANQKGVTVNEQAVDKEIESIKARYDSEQEFLEVLISQGATITDLMDKIRDQIKMRVLIEDDVRAKIRVNPQEVTEYFKNHFEDFQKPERVDLDSIFIARGEDPAKTKETAEAALAALKEGKDFHAVAKEYSQAASIGLIKRGQMLSAIEETVFALAVGDISPVVEVDTGFYIFKIKEKLPQEVSSLEEVREQITNILFQEKFRNQYRLWMDSLKKKAFIEIKS